MSIKQKVLKICVGITILSGIAYFSLIYFVIFPYLQVQERREINREMSRVTGSLEKEITRLDSFVQDWAVWDDSYQFIQDRNMTFITRNLSDSTFSAQKINMIAYVSYSSGLVYAKAYDLVDKREVSVPEGLVQQVYKRFLQLGGMTNVKGIAAIPGSPVLISVLPVVDSLEEKPAKGILIIGRYLDDYALRDITNLLQMPVQIKKTKVVNSAQEIYRLKDSSVDIKIANKNNITASKIITDIFAENQFLLQVTDTRDSYKQGLNSVTLFGLLLLLTAVLFGFVIYHLLERKFVSRLIQLKQNIDSIKKFEDIPDIIVTNGNDEIAALSVKIGQMLTELKDTHTQVKYLSIYDSLTGVHNRTFFDEYLGKYDVVMDKSIGVIMCDIDGLKLANDIMGHALGDTMLKNVAAALQSSVPQDAVIARIGGDEFIIIIENIQEDLQVICQRITEAVDSGISGLELGSIPISISLGYAQKDELVQSVTELARIADNYMYREKLHRNQSTRSGLVQTLRSALEARDHLTEDHAGRMAALVAAVADKYGMTQDRMPDLKLFTEFHDVGKIGIPDSILFKPGALTEQEWVQMKTHSEIGYRIAHATPDLSPIADFILKHHERWDGKGYPLGLAGTEIPLECRILAIVDAYDAMTSDRPYRKAMSSNEAVMVLRENSSTQFDSELIEVFITILQDRQEFIDE